MRELSHSEGALRERTLPQRSSLAERTGRAQPLQELSGSHGDGQHKNPVAGESSDRRVRLIDSPPRRVIRLPAHRANGRQGAEQLRKAVRMPVVRFRPGEHAPWTGTYALTTEWERTPHSVPCNKGERLPLLAITASPHWFVLVETIPAESAQAA